MQYLANNNLLLRALEPEDLEILYRWENDTELWQYGSTLTPYSRFTLRDYINNSLQQDIFQSRQLRLMITEKTSAKTLGTIDLYDFDPIHQRAGVGILIDKDFHRRNYGFQSLELIKQYTSKVLNLHQLYAYIPKNNEASYRLFLKSGFSESGLLKSWIKTENDFEDVWCVQKIFNL
ncbi:MAG: GNAT family N-acetyltransferase [Dysgonamonadaceae bacterium]|jgi:diamine N-acetyltransferase|nr:GNAT family N-acetyltransferase [Dysgonamonadaceae bacterium]